MSDISDCPLPIFLQVSLKMLLLHVKVEIRSRSRDAMGMEPG